MDNRTIHPSKDVAKGTLRKILKDVSIAVEDFEELGGSLAAHIKR